MANSGDHVAPSGIPYNTTANNWWENKVSYRKRIARQRSCQKFLATAGGM